MHAHNVIPPPSSRYLIPFLAISVTHHPFSSLPLPIQDMVHSLFRHLPKDVRNRRLREGRISVSTTKLSLRAASRIHDVPYATLRRHILSGGNISVQGRHPSLHPAEEKLIADAALHFALNGTPLSCECLKDMMQHFIQRLPLHRRTKLPFRDCRPGDRYVKSLLERNPSLSMKRRCNLGKDRATAISPHNLVEHFARLQQLYKEFQITSGAQIFNLDESGFSTRTAFRARPKAAIQSQGRSNSTELKWSSNAAHVTTMPVVSADGTL